MILTLHKSNKISYIISIKFQRGTKTEIYFSPKSIKPIRVKLKPQKLLNIASNYEAKILLYKMLPKVITEASHNWKCVK